MKIFLLFLMALVVSSSFISAVPEVPMIVSGEAYINDKPARVGTKITAFVGGNEIANSEVSIPGAFAMLLQKLEEGEKVEFYVDGISADESIYYEKGNLEQLSLKVKKSYLIYYFGGALIFLTTGFLIWKRKFLWKKEKK